MLKPPKLSTPDELQIGCFTLTLVDDEFAPIFRVFFEDERIQRALIGHANCLNCGEVLRLQDIEIKANVGLFYRAAGLRALFGWRRKGMRSFQRLGLGTALLQYVIRYAKNQRFKQIVGEIFPRDYERNPMLPEWYARNGFVVTPNRKLFNLSATL